MHSNRAFTFDNILKVKFRQIIKMVFSTHFYTEFI